MSSPIAPRIAERRLRESVREHVSNLRAVEQHVQVMPRDIESQVVLNPDRSTSTDLYFDFGPITYRVRERAGSGSPNLFVVVEGYLQVSRTLRGQRLITTGFGTHVGYFRFKEQQAALSHDFGVHYDFDSTKSDHPAFHAQFNTFLDLHHEVNDQFKLSAVAEDRVKNLIRGVRVPTAQMDVLSVILQICADHAMHRKASPSQLKSFAKMRRSCDLLVGAAHSLPRFDPSDPNCYRAPHWYDVEASPA